MSDPRILRSPRPPRPKRLLRIYPVWLGQHLMLYHHSVMMKSKLPRMHGIALAATVLFFLSQASCSIESQTAAVQAGDRDALNSITAQDLLQRIRILASDEFEGRAPGTRGETLTLEYLTGEFERLGLGPGNPDGTFMQAVALIAIRGTPTASFTTGKHTMRLRYPEEYLAVSRHNKPEVGIDSSEMVFVGYGIVAPEYGWDDYKGADLGGKTLVMLINDPPVPDPSQPTRLDEKVFGGKRMTYYGRWTYKFEIAAEKGAAAVILVHETGPAGYPYNVLIRSWSGESFTIEKNGDRENRVPVESWITGKTAAKLFSAAGLNFGNLKKAAGKRDFEPVPIGARASFSIRNTIRSIRSHNVVAKLDGADRNLRNQYVVYSAHWDHLGKNGNLKGDQVYNGALDNASGTAGLLEIAEAYSRLDARPRRTLVFLSPTGEEKGLLGAQYYTENPLYPLAATTANINLDCLNPWGRTRDIVIIGLDSSPLHQVAREAAASQGKRVRPDLEPDKGFFYRSDHFEFAKQGVPTLYTDAGIDLIGRPAEYGKRKRGEYSRRDYHKVTDEVKPDWDLSGAVEDLRYLFLVGLRVAENGLPAQ